MQRTLSTGEKIKGIERLADSLISEIGEDSFVLDTSIIYSPPFHLEKDSSDQDISRIRSTYYDKLSTWILDPKRTVTSSVKGELQKLLFFARLKNVGEIKMRNYTRSMEAINIKLIPKLVYPDSESYQKFMEMIKDYERKDHKNSESCFRNCSYEDLTSIAAMLDLASKGNQTGLASMDSKQIVLACEMSKYADLPVDIITYDRSSREYVRAKVEKR